MLVEIDTLLTSGSELDGARVILGTGISGTDEIPSLVMTEYLDPRPGSRITMRPERLGYFLELINMYSDLNGHELISQPMMRATIMIDGTLSECQRRSSAYLQLLEGRCPDGRYIKVVTSIENQPVYLTEILDTSKYLDNWLEFIWRKHGLG